MELVTEPHGGYLCRYQDIDVSWLKQLALDALREDGQSGMDVGLQVTVLGHPEVVRFAFDGPFTYGRSGAQWYRTHHALARRLSEHLRLTVHSYVYDSDELEQVVAFGDGRRVGGELIRYEDVDLDDDGDEAYVFAASKWPLGHLARVFGLAREELVRIPRRPTALLELMQHSAPQPLWQLFPERLRVRAEVVEPVPA